MLQYVAACCRSLLIRLYCLCTRLLQCVLMSYSALQCVATCCSVLQRFDGAPLLSTHMAVAVCCSVLQCVVVRCSVLQCLLSTHTVVAACCSALQCDAASILLSTHTAVTVCSNALQWHTMGWLRLVGSIQLLVSFAEYCLFYRTLLQKRPIILSILLTKATPYTDEKTSL